MNPIAIFYHCLMCGGDPPEILDHAVSVVAEQMGILRDSGLLHACSEMTIGLNGGTESRVVSSLVLPHKANIIFHGLQCRTENRTILAMENWLKAHPDWYVCYFHSKGATHKNPNDFSKHWRDCMMRYVIANWEQCVRHLDEGYDAVGAHWMMPPATPEGHYEFAGNFWWANSNYLLTLPSILEREQIKRAGLDALESRYEAEVWMGMGPYVPVVKDFHGPKWNPGKWQQCRQ